MFRKPYADDDIRCPFPLRHRRDGVEKRAVRQRRAVDLHRAGKRVAWRSTPSANRRGSRREERLPHLGKRRLRPPRTEVSTPRTLPCPANGQEPPNGCKTAADQKGNGKVFIIQSFHEFHGIRGGIPPRIHGTHDTADGSARHDVERDPLFFERAQNSQMQPYLSPRRFPARGRFFSSFS